MRIKLVGSTIDDTVGKHFAASYIVNDRLGIDAGTIGFMSCLDQQRAIKDLFISHAHLDHLASLPIFLDNIYQPGPDCPTVYGNDAVREVLLRDILNDRVWPDLIRVSYDESPFLNFVQIQAGDPVELNELRVTPVALNHVVASLGFVIEDDTTAIAIVSDTSQTEEIWEVAGSKPHLKAVFLEAAFPNSMRWLADKTGHLTPALFAQEYRKLAAEVPVIAVHIKPAFHDEVVDDLEALRLPSVQVGVPNTEYVF